MIAIVTDSTCGLTREQAQTQNITLLPMWYGTEQEAFEEQYLEETPTGVLTDDNVMMFTTKSPKLRDYYNAFKSCSNQGMDVICLTVSSRFSTAYKKANEAKEMIQNANITVIDSALTAGGMYLLLQRTIALVKENRALSYIEEDLNEAKKKIGIVFSVEDMNILRKSRRIGRVAQSTATILNIRPILLCVNGTIVAGGVARGTKAQTNRLLEKIPQEAKKVIVHYTEKTPAAILEQVFQSVKKAHQVQSIEKIPLGNVLKVHLGLNVIGIAWDANQDVQLNKKTKCRR